MDFRVNFLAAFLLGVCGASMAADLEAGKKIVLQGNGKAASACNACHGAGGDGSVTASFPRLSHLDADYLAKQLRDFQRDKRKDAVMHPIAKTLSESEIVNVSAYFAAQTPTAPPEKVNPALAARGARIALSGLWEKTSRPASVVTAPAGTAWARTFPHSPGSTPVTPVPIGWRARPRSAWPCPGAAIQRSRNRRKRRASSTAPGCMRRNARYVMARTAPAPKSRALMCSRRCGARIRLIGARVWIASIPPPVSSRPTCRSAKPNSLSDQDAWDVASFINSRERPQDPRFTGDAAETKKSFHDENCHYGDMVDGIILGAGKK